MCVGGGGRSVLKGGGAFVGIQRPFRQLQQTFKNRQTKQPADRTDASRHSNCCLCRNSYQGQRSFRGHDLNKNDQ